MVIGRKALEVDASEYFRRYQTLSKYIQEFLYFREFCEYDIGILFRNMDSFGNSHQNRIEHIVNNVCIEVEQRLQQNEVLPSKCSTSNIYEESEKSIMVECKLLQSVCMREESCAEEDEEAP